jgi:hypothetical protein
MRYVVETCKDPKCHGQTLRKVLVGGKVELRCPNCKKFK